MALIQILEEVRSLSTKLKERANGMVVCLEHSPEARLQLSYVRDGVNATADAFVSLVESSLQAEQSDQSTLTRQGLIAENERYRRACEEFRDTVLNQRHQLCDNNMTNDQVNDVLNAFDETIGAVLGEKTKQ